MASENESIKAPSPRIHLVVGDCGDYSDHEYWFVSAHDNKTEAEQVVQVLALAAETAYEEDDLEALVKLDRFAQYGHPPAEYEVVSVPLGVGQKIQEKILASSPPRNP